MARRRGRLPRDKSGKPFAYRAGKVQTTGDGGIRLTLATETPVRVYDYQRNQVVDEVLLMDGLDFASQVPMLDSHNRYESRNVIGSIRELQVNDARLDGTAFFASADSAQEIKQLYDEGHMTDFSVGFSVDTVEYVADGESSTIGGRTFDGPMRVVTRATVKEGSTVPIGADENAKVMPAMRAYAVPDQLYEEFQMDKLRELALAAGMPEDHGDVERWVADELAKRQQPVTPREPEPKPEPKPTPEPTRDVDAEVKAERERVREITQLCKNNAVNDVDCQRYIDDVMSVGDVALAILKKRNVDNTDDTPVGTIEPVDSQRDKMSDQFANVLLHRCLVNCNIPEAKSRAKGELVGPSGERVVAGKTDADALARITEVERQLTTGYRPELRSISMVEMARAYCTESGVDTRMLHGHEIVRRALALETRDGAAYHTTGSLPNLLLDAANKTLLMAYDEAPATYSIWTRQAPSAPDFKTLNRIRLGELPEPDVVTENGEYGEAQIDDNKESYAVEKYGKIFSITLEAIVNDDLNAISRIPQRQGNAMRRRVNKTVYQVLALNAALSDGVALFHATSHGANLDSNALSAANLSTGFQIMMLQTGISSGTVLNLAPRFLLVPAALSATALQILNSIADPTQTSSRPAFNEGTINLYGPQGPRQLIPVIDANIDSLVSGTAWYLAADTGQIDTVEITFLRGEEAPVLDREVGFKIDAIRYKIRQTFAAKAIDYRGLYQGNS